MTLLLAAAMMLLATGIKAMPEETTPDEGTVYDICVYGSTPAGILAAYTA